MEQRAISNSSTVDVIKKPRTEYSKKILRRVVPNFDISKKIESISMSRIKMLTYLNFNGSDDHRRVKTVD
jgi:hypothetical protein